MSAYDNVIGGKLKLKGKALDVKAGGVKKKKKHKKQEEQALKITEHELIEGENAEALGKLIEGDEEEGEEKMDRSEKASEDAKLQHDDDDHLTPAERRYIEQKRRLDVQKLAKDANKSHRNRIEDFNQYLANMSEHYDIPKVGPVVLFGLRGPGMAEGLKILEKVKVAYDLPIVTDVHESSQCEAVGKVADIIQIPAFLCRQTDLLVAAAQTGKIINIKKGQFCAPSVMRNSAEKIRLAGNPNVMVCERGTMFGYNDLIVDPRNLEWMREADCPVVADITHSLQQPAGKKLDGGGVASGGLRELIPCIARTAVAVGVNGIFMEVHDDPLSAPVDGPTQWPLRHLEELLEELIAIARVTKGKQPFQIDLTPYRD